MIDLESLGTNNDCVFVSIGACLFDPFTNEIDHGNTFYERIDWDSSFKEGRTFNVPTMKWWLQQSDAARNEICKEGNPLSVVLKQFENWLPEDPIVWGNGSTFDISILNHAYNNCPKWKFWNIRDVRTVLDIAKGLYRKPKIEGTAHNALDDALYQAKYVCDIYKLLRSK
jgi:hypothetical protein